MRDDDRSAVDRLLDGRAELAGCLLIRSGLRFPGRDELERGSGVLGPDHVDDRQNEQIVKVPSSPESPSSVSSVR